MKAATAAPRALEQGRWIQVAEAARRLGVSTGRIYHLITDHRLESRQVEGLYYVSAAGVTKYRRYQALLRRVRALATGGNGANGRAKAAAGL